MFQVNKAIEEYKQMLSEYQQGGLSAKDYQQKLQGLVGQDSNGRYWTISVDGYLIWHDGKEWIKAKPISAYDIASTNGLQSQPEVQNPLNQHEIKTIQQTDNQITQALPKDEANQTEATQSIDAKVLNQQGKSSQEDYAAISFIQLLKKIGAKLPQILLKQLPKFIIIFVVGLIVHSIALVYGNEGFNYSTNFYNTLVMAVRNRGTNPQLIIGSLLNPFLNLRGLGLNSGIFYALLGYLIPLLGRNLKSGNLMGNLSSLVMMVPRTLKQVFSDKKNLPLFIIFLAFAFLFGNRIRPLTSMMMMGVGMGAISSLLRVKKQTGNTNPTLAMISKSGGSTLYMLLTIVISDISKWLAARGQKRIKWDISKFTAIITLLTSAIMVGTMLSQLLMFESLGLPFTIFSNITILNIGLFMMLLPVGVILLVIQKGMPPKEIKPLVLLLMGYMVFKVQELVVWADDGGASEAVGPWITSEGALVAISQGVLPPVAVGVGLGWDQAIKKTFEDLIPQLEEDSWWQDHWTEEGAYIPPEEMGVQPKGEEDKEEEEVLGFDMLTDVSTDTVIADGANTVWVYGKVVAQNPEDDLKAQQATESITFRITGSYANCLKPAGNIGMTDGYKAMEYIASTPMSVKEHYGSTSVLLNGGGLCSGVQIVYMEFVTSDLYISFRYDKAEIIYAEGTTKTITAAVYSQNLDYPEQNLKEFNLQMEMEGDRYLTLTDKSWNEEYMEVEVAFPEIEGLTHLPQYVKLKARVVINGEVLEEILSLSVIAQPELRMEDKPISFLVEEYDEVEVKGTLYNGGVLDEWELTYEPEGGVDGLFTYTVDYNKDELIVKVTNESEADDTRFEGTGNCHETIKINGKRGDFTVYGQINVKIGREGLYASNFGAREQTSSDIRVSAEPDADVTVVQCYLRVWDENRKELVKVEPVADIIDARFGEKDSLLHQNIFEITKLRLADRESVVPSMKVYTLPVEKPFHMSAEVLNIPLVFYANYNGLYYEKEMMVRFQPSLKDFQEYALEMEKQKCHELVDKLLEPSDLNRDLHRYVEQWAPYLNSIGINYVRRIIISKAMRYNEEVAKGYLNQAFYYELAEYACEGLDFFGNIALNVLIITLSGPAAPAVLIIRAMGMEFLRQQLILMGQCLYEGVSYEEWADRAYNMLDFKSLGIEVTLEVMQASKNPKVAFFATIAQILYGIYQVYQACDKKEGFDYKLMCTSVVKVILSVTLTTLALQFANARMSKGKQQLPDPDGPTKQKTNSNSDDVLVDLNSKNSSKNKAAKEYLEKMFGDKKVIDGEMSARDALEIMRDPQAVRTIKDWQNYPPEVQDLLKSRAEGFSHKMKEINRTVDDEFLKELKRKYPDREFTTQDIRKPKVDKSGSALDEIEINTDRDIRVVEIIDGKPVEFPTENWRHDYNEKFSQYTGLNGAPNPHQTCGISKDDWDKMSDIQKQESWAKAHRQESTDFKHAQSCIDYSDQAHVMKDGKLVRVERPNILDVKEGKTKLKDPNGIGEMMENKVFAEYSNTPQGKSEAIKQYQKGVQELFEIQEGYKKGGFPVKEMDPEFLKVANELKDLKTDYNASFDSNQASKYAAIDEAKLQKYTELLKKEYSNLSEVPLELEPDFPMRK